MAIGKNETIQDQMERVQRGPAGHSDGRGSGSDINSDVDRLEDEDNLQDKIDEDSFPASDAPSHSPMTGVGRKKRESHDPSGLKENFKNDKGAQFEYGRRSQASTLHFDTSTNRLRKGNPNIGEVDLGTITADKPAQPDDDDLYDSADDGESGTPTDK